MIPEDPIDFDYALENTQVIIPPKQAIATFGETHFQFQLITEMMDEANVFCLRKGTLEAQRPRILAPNRLQQVLLEGFEEEESALTELLESYTQHLKILRYGFHLKKTDISEEIIRGPREELFAKITEEVLQENNPMSTFIEGVDDAWEACLLKFTIDLIERSAGENYGEWQRRGLLS